MAENILPEIIWHNLEVVQRVSVAFEQSIRAPAQKKKKAKKRKEKKKEEEEEKEEEEVSRRALTAGISSGKNGWRMSTATSRPSDANCNWPVACCPPDVATLAQRLPNLFSASSSTSCQPRDILFMEAFYPALFSSYSLSFTLSLSLYIYIYVCVYIYIYVCACVCVLCAFLYIYLWVCVSVDQKYIRF